MGLAEQMFEMAEFFARWTYTYSKGRLMVVDIQGWNLGTEKIKKSFLGCGRRMERKRDILYTDPQIHAVSPGIIGHWRDDPLHRRFSLGNLGRVGMVRFFQSHECSESCRHLSLTSVLPEDRHVRPEQTLYHRKGSVLPTALPAAGEALDIIADDVPLEKLADAC